MRQLPHLPHCGYGPGSEHYNARYLSIFLSIFRGMSAVCGLRFTDLRRVAFSASKDFNSYQLLQTKGLNSHVI